MRVSTRGDYAARALLSLALHPESSPTSVREIAERTVLPQPYLEQILLALRVRVSFCPSAGSAGGTSWPAMPARSDSPRSFERSTVPSPPEISPNRTPTRHAITRGNVSCSPFGAPLGHICVSFSIRSRSPTLPTWRWATHPGHPDSSTTSGEKFRKVSRQRRLRFEHNA